MNLLLRLLILLVLGSGAQPLLGQDPYFSQFFANRVYLNPAYAGFDPGVTLTLNYRDQWFGVPDASSTPFQAGFRTYNATVNFQLPCFDRLENNSFGVALSFFRDEAGGAPLVTTGGAIASSIGLRLAGKSTRSSFLEDLFADLRRLDLRAGFQMSIAQRKLESDFLIYSHQLDPVVGLDGQLPSGIMLRSATYFNFNAGVLLRGNFRRKKDQDNLFSIGFSVNNVNEPNVSLRDVASQVFLPMRTTFYFSTTHQIKRFKGTVQPWYFTPQFRWDRQFNGELNLQTVGFYAFQQAYIGGVFLQYNFPGDPVTNNGAVGPLTARNTTTVILHSSIDLKTVFDHGRRRHKRDSGLVLGLTYDIPLSGVGADAATGVIELNLRMNFWGNNRRKGSCLDLSPMEMYNGKCPWRY